MPHPLAPAWLTEPDNTGALDPSVWPSGASRADDGIVTLGGVRVTELASRFGTPLYVLDEVDLRARAAEVRAAFSREFERIGSSATVYYAAKAFLCTEVARWVTDAGLNIDLCSGGELAVALAAGVDPSRLGFNGNNKSDAELDRAVSVGLGAIVIDSVSEIDRIADVAARHDRVQAVRVRVNTGVHASTHEHLSTAREDQKFGITIADTPAAVAAIRLLPSLRFLGLHSHVGSQILETEGFIEATRRMVALHTQLLEGGEVPQLDLGGGFGVPYTSADVALPVDLVARTLADTVAAECARLGIPLPHIAVEPGRSIAGPAGVTLYEAGTVKDVLVDTDAAAPAVRRYVSVDGGMSDNARTALYAADYSVRLASRESTADAALVRVVGKHCESGDIIVRSDFLPGDVRPGDLLAVPVTGAYCWSLSSNYNYLGRPAVVAVRHGSARVIVRGETERDVLSRDAGIPPFPAANPDSAAPGAPSVAHAGAAASAPTEGSTS